MPIVAIVNQKGGCAKSTTAVHLAYWLQSEGNAVAVIDADAQRSSSIWLEGLEGVSIPYHVIQSADELLEQIPDIAADAMYPTPTPGQRSQETLNGHILPAVPKSEFTLCKVGIFPHSYLGDSKADIIRALLHSLLHCVPAQKIQRTL